MTVEMYRQIEVYMLDCMEDAAHDKEHIYRVLGLARQLAEQEEEPVDEDILTAACLLHDIGRQEQFQNPALCHAQVGSERAFAFLLGLGWSEDQAGRVRHCVLTHRFRSDRPPKSLEAKLLFDADKLDVTGAMGIARTLYYGGRIGGALYTRDGNGPILEPDGEGSNTFLQEYRHKLERIDRGLYTPAAREMAARRAPAARAFYQALVGEILESHRIKEMPL